MVWMGERYYNPKNRDWMKHHDVRGAPNARVPGQIEFPHEDAWREWQKNRDTPGSGSFCASSGKTLILETSILALDHWYSGLELSNDDERSTKNSILQIISPKLI